MRFTRILSKISVEKCPIEYLAYEVLEWDDGTIQIMTYKDFLPFDRPEALEAIKKLSLYLNKKRLDGARMIPEIA